MKKKNNTFLGEVTDSIIIGGLAYYFFKGIKIILLIIFWPIALLLKIKPKR